MPGFSKSQIDKLGERLRAVYPPELSDLKLLQNVRAEYEPALRRVEAIVRRVLPGTTVLSRLKTTNTIVEKLRREATTRLSAMQDLAGARVVTDSTLREQDTIVALLAGEFEKPRLVDRRESPSSGYRAVHLIAQVDGKPIEIQVRTRLQNRWAQAMEMLGDIAGRDIRYGGQAREVLVGDRAAAEVVAQHLKRSVTIAKVEKLLDVFPDVRRRAGQNLELLQVLSDADSGLMAVQKSLTSELDSMMAELEKNP